MADQFIPCKRKSLPETVEEAPDRFDADGLGHKAKIRIRKVADVRKHLGKLV